MIQDVSMFPLSLGDSTTEEELREAAESVGQCHVHPGDDSGTRMEEEGRGGEGGL